MQPFKKTERKEDRTGKRGSDGRCRPPCLFPYMKTLVQKIPELIPEHKASSSDACYMDLLYEITIIILSVGILHNCFLTLVNTNQHRKTKESMAELQLKTIPPPQAVSFFNHRNLRDASIGT